jgi:hypothetical protein
MQSEQLLPKSQVLQEKFFSGAKAGGDPAEQMSNTHKHPGIIAKTAPNRRATKSLILQTCKVLARHRPRGDRFDRNEPIAARFAPVVFRSN